MFGGGTNHADSAVVSGLQNLKKTKYAEGTVSIVGITKHYGELQLVVVDSDLGTNPRIKFPGLKFRAFDGKTLEESASARFEEQTGFEIENVQLKLVMPTRSRHDAQWIFRNIFFGNVADLGKRKKNDGRGVYLAYPGSGTFSAKPHITPLDKPDLRVPANWVSKDNILIAREAQQYAHTPGRFRQIPCMSAMIKDTYSDKELGCALGVASMIVLYQPSPSKEQKVILIKRKGDEYPGLPGGKIETQKGPKSLNVDPVSCCVAEGSEELNFRVLPRALIGCAITPLSRPFSDERRAYYNAIINYAFVVRPVNTKEVERALKHPKLEEKMEGYVVYSLKEFRREIDAGRLRMPDNMPIGKKFFETNPGDYINLEQIIWGGAR